jgi:DNA repair protein SbcC/Rad50
MQVHRLRLVNFRQHEDTDLHFGPGLTGVVGPNGSGKTTLLEGLAWAIYGSKAARGTVDSIRRRGAPARARVEVTVEFSLGAHSWRVTRTLHGAELYLDGEAAPVANSSSAVTERLTRVLGMTRDEFFNTYFTGQKELAIMGSMSALEREKFLSRVLGYERLAAGQKRLQVERSDLRARLQTLEAMMVSPVELAEEEARARRRLDAAAELGRRTAAGLREAEGLLARERPAWEAAQRLQEQVRSLESDLRVAEQQVTDARDAFGRLDRELTEAVAAKGRLDELAPVLAPLAALQEEREHLDAQATRLARRREALGKVSELRKQLGEVDGKLAGFPEPGALAALRARLDEARKDAAVAERTAEERRTAWVQNRQDAQTKLAQLEDQGRDLKKQRELLRDAGPEGACPTCNRPLGASYGDVLRDLDAQLAEVAVNYRFYQARVRQLRDEPAELQEAVTARDAAQAVLSRETAELSRAETREQQRTAMGCERQVLTERLAAEEALLGEDAVGFDEARHTLVLARLRELEPLRHEAARLEVIAERAASLTGQASESEAELSRREERVRDLGRRLSESGWSPEAFTAAREAVVAADRARHEAEVAVVKAGAEAEAARTAVAEVERRRAERERREMEVRALQGRFLLNQELDRALGDLRGELNHTLRPDLSDLGSRFLRDLTSGRYTEFELNEDYVPAIVEDGEPQTVLSGGEEDVVSLALRLAISQMIAERAGQPLSLLVLDEIFGSLDEERRTAVVELLRRLADRFPQVVLITHIDTVRDGFDRLLRLTYDIERRVARVAEEPLGDHDAAA